MKTSEMLEIIKPHLWDGSIDGAGQIFLCSAAEDALSFLDANVCKDIFMKRLDGTRTLEIWLYARHGIDAYNNTKKTQATRLAWLNSLIAEYRAKGD